MTFFLKRLNTFNMKKLNQGHISSIRETRATNSMELSKEEFQSGQEKQETYCIIVMSILR